MRYWELFKNTANITDEGGTICIFSFFEQWGIQSFLALFLYIESNANNAPEPSAMKIVLNRI